MPVLLSRPAKVGFAREAKGGEPTSDSSATGLSFAIAPSHISKAQ
jgi:hypothetical protein